MLYVSRRNKIKIKMELMLLLLLDVTERRYNGIILHTAVRAERGGWIYVVNTKNNENKNISNSAWWFGIPFTNHFNEMEEFI